MNEMSLEHGNLDRSYVATLLLGQVKYDPVYGIKNVIQTVKDQLGFDVSYAKAWYSLKMAREKVYGTWESSVRKLPRLMGAIQKWNPGTVVEWEHKGFQHSSGAYVIKYVFWAFKPCIEGFQFCRKVISVDGTHLYTKYKHKMLIAAAMDGNQQMVSKHIVRGMFGMCLISDCNAGLMGAIDNIPEFVPPRGVHRLCLRHVCSNFNNRLKDFCWIAGSEYQIRKFDRIMEEIRGIKPEARYYLYQIEKQKWTASHDGGWRCGILTIKILECINGVLKGARRLHVTAIADMTSHRSVSHFDQRMTKSSVMLKNNQLWTDYA
ncbi:UNVERIFIED_CONTAM: hypothetical protein Slati_1360400 [Sesamum latifolium]|uniref:Transposase n=1 Tax=Sesamum latifolium TaxID=2727402 RepID=A0AAW2XIH3_9LAMI